VDAKYRATETDLSTDDSTTRDGPPASPGRWANITALLDNAGHVTIGRVAHIEGAAIAADENTVFATVLRRKDEPFEELVGRLDQAIGRLLYEGVQTNELEGGHFEVATPVRPKKK
jgi:hypothetical protein